VVAAACLWGWVLIGTASDHARGFTSRFECGTHPEDFLRPGELLERSSLRFIVEAHCANVRYPSDDIIELRYGGFPFHIETARFSIAGTPYAKILFVGEGEGGGAFAGASQREGDGAAP
jgi:hypothetical protein